MTLATGPAWAAEGVHGRPELKADPGLAPEEHALALRGLARLNRASGAGGALWRAVRRWAARGAGEGAALRVLDVASGGGDVLIAAARCAAQAGAHVEWAGCDRSPTAVSHARRAAERAGAAIEFFEADALGALPAGEWDVLTSSLFLHHLDEARAVRLLRAMREAARRGVAVSDLRRSRAGVALAWGASRALTRSRVVHADAVTSARQAYTMDEARGLAERAGLAGTIVTARWPLRLLLEWERA